MGKDRLSSYLGLSRRAGKLRSGYNTCLSLIRSGHVSLLIVAEDAAQNTKDKMSQKCRSKGIDCRIFGKSEDLSRAAGFRNGSVFAVTDSSFAKVMQEEIDRTRSEGVGNE